MKNKKIHFIDCGANVGQSIYWALTNYGNKLCRIDSFEPQTENFDYLRERYGTHELVNLHKNAVWKANEKKELFLQERGTRTGSSLVKGKSSTNEHATETVQCIDLSEWIYNNISPENYNILKIDIEGGEHDLLPYLFENKIHEVVDEWFIELHSEEKTPNYKPSTVGDIKKYTKKWTDWMILGADSLDAGIEAP